MKRPRQGNSNHLLGAFGAGVVVVVFCLLLLRHDPYFFWADDYQISILPVFADVARSWSEGQWPLLSPYSWACGNLAGEFQYGTFSIFVNAAVLMIWKLPLAFWHQAAALSIAHLFVLAMGAYLLARGRDLSPPLSLMVAIVAALNGWMMCWGASDWFGALAAFAWLPWSWWAMEKALRPDGARWHVLLPAPFIYLLIAGGFPYTIAMLALVTVWLGLRNLDWRPIFRLTSGWLLGLGLSAPAWMSLLEITPGSRRAVEQFVPNQWLVPLGSLPGLLLPSWTVNWHEFEDWIAPHYAIELACGFAPVVILIAAACIMPKGLLAKARWEIGLLLLILLLCVLPSAGVFRFSFRWLALFHLVLALVAVEAFRLCNERLVRYFAHPALIAWLLPLVAFVSLLLTYLRLDPHPVVAHYFFTEQLNSPAPLDPNRLYLSLYPAPQSWYRADMTGVPFGAVVRPGSTSMWSGVHLINGYTPIAPAGVARLFSFGTHGHIDPAKVRDLVIPESKAGGLLEQLGVDGIIVGRDFNLPAPLPNEWKLIHSEWEGDVFHREEPLPRVRALPDDTHTDARVEIVENSRQKVIANVVPNELSHSARIVFSRPYFPGYHASLNGQALAVTSLEGLIPVVHVPAGEKGRLELVYRPRAVTWGGVVVLFSLTAGVVMLVVCRRDGGSYKTT